MTTETEKIELLEEFQSYLAQNPATTFAVQEPPDLHTLLSELTGLKTEVKLESRQFKNTLDTLGSALATVQEDNKALSAEVELYQQRLEQQQADMMRAMLLEMIDLYDRLSNGVALLHNYRPVKSLFKQSRKKDVRFIERFKEGQLMTIRRFEQLLHSYQVRAIDCAGKLLDPVTMNAVETDCDPKHSNGIVLEELRKGFLFKDQVLRLADVKVNKIKVQ